MFRLKRQPAPAQLRGWNELLTPETEKISNFYANVIGWKIKVTDAEDQQRPPANPENRYTIFLNGDQEVAGLVSQPSRCHSFRRGLVHLFPSRRCRYGRGEGQTKWRHDLAPPHRNCRRQSYRTRQRSRRDHLRPRHTGRQAGVLKPMRGCMKAYVVKDRSGSIKMGWLLRNGISIKASGAASHRAGP